MRGRQKTWWKDSCKRDMERVGIKEKGVLDRTKWMHRIQNHSDDPQMMGTARGEVLHGPET